MYETQTVLQLILDKSSLVNTSKGIATAFTQTLGGVAETLRGGTGGGIYGSAPTASEPMQKTTDLQMQSLAEDLKLTDLEREELQQLKEIHKVMGETKELEKLRTEVYGGGEEEGGDGSGLGEIAVLLKGGILKALAPLAILAIMFAEFWQFIQPIFKLISLIMLILFIPVFRALKGFLADMPSKMDAFKQAQGEAGGGLGGFFNMLSSAFFTPITDIFLNTAEAIVSGITIALFDGIKLIVASVFDAIIGLLDGFEALGLEILKLIPFSEDAQVAFSETMKGIKDDVRKLKENTLSIIDTAEQLTLASISSFFVATKFVLSTGTMDLTEIVTVWMEDLRKKAIEILNPSKTPSGGLSGVWEKADKEMYGPGGLFPTPYAEKHISTQNTSGSSNFTSGGGTAEGGGGGGVGDFISRPGMDVQSFSPNDTIIGMKDLSGLMKGANGVTIDYRPTYHIDATTDKNELRKIFDEHDEKVKREFQSALSYVTNLRG